MLAHSACNKGDTLYETWKMVKHSSGFDNSYAWYWRFRSEMCIRDRPSPARAIVDTSSRKRVETGLAPSRAIRSPGPSTFPRKYVLYARAQNL